MASSAARPAECAPLSASSASNVWERAKYPALRRYCDLLASGAAKLAATPSPDEAREAMANAAEAARALPDRAAPAVLRGRALVALGQYREAAAILDTAVAHDPRALDDPAALFAWGRALGRVGRLADAEEAFRALLPRASSLAPSERGKAEIEAAFLAEARGPSGIDQAIPLFRQARRDAQDALHVLASVGLALALDRAGEHDEARASDGGRQDPRDALGEGAVREALSDVGALAEADALVAFSARIAGDAPGAKDAWTRYLAGSAGKGPWADHARASIANEPRAPRGGKGR